MSRKLLLADDSATIQKVIEITLSDKDYILQVASDGDEALQLASNEKPDLIMADVFMPGKDGYEVCSAVRSDPTLKDVPVLLLAGTFEPFDKDKAKAVGANDWIVKPFSSQALVDKVEELLALAPQAEQWQATPSVAPADQDILQALEEVTAAQAQEPVAPVEPAAPSFEPPPLEMPVEQAGPAVPEPEPLVTEPTTENQFEELAPFAGFDVEEESAPETELNEPLEIEPPRDFELPAQGVEFTSDSSVDPFAVEAPPAAQPESQETEFSFNVEPEITEEPEPVIPEPVADLPPLEEFQTPAAQPQPEPTPPAADGVVDLREEDIVEEGAYGAVPERVEKRVAFLSDEQLTEIVERVAGAVIEKLAAPIVEQVVWDVVPDLAESMVREEMSKIKPGDGQ